MAYRVTTQDIALLKQRQKNVSIKLELLNQSFKIVDVIEGLIIDDDYSIDATSQIRRTFQGTLVATNQYVTLGEEKKVWIDKYIRVYIGVENMHSHEIHWYLTGTYAFDGANSSFDASTATLRLSCADMMCLLDGTLSGQLIGVQTKILEGSNIRNSVISTITQLGGVKDYYIPAFTKRVPYDLEFSTGATVWDVLEEFLNITMGYEMFFDLDGVFHYQPIPTGHNERVEIDKETLLPLVIRESVTEDITKVRNYTKVFGKCVNADYYTTSVTQSGTTYEATFTGLTSLPMGTTLGMKIPTTNTGGTLNIKVNSIGTYRVYTENNTNPAAGRLQAGKSYVFRFRNNQLILQGEWQIAALVKEVLKQPTAAQIQADKKSEGLDNIKYVVNPDSPFAIEKIGLRRQVLSGGDYEDIYSEDLALERAEYENWLKTRMTATVNLRIMAIPFLDVNQVVEYTRGDNGETDQYIIKEIRGSVNEWQQDITMIKYYPLYPFIVT